MTVDVLFPYYGDVAMMKQAVESVLGQTTSDWTLTVIDDGYPDDSIPGYFSDLTDQDPRVTYVRNDVNLGANGNYRKALTFVRHELAVVMGADDIMLSTFIETVVSAHKQFPSAQIIQPGVEVIDEHNHPSMGLIDRMKRLYAPRVHGPSGRRLLSGEPLAISLMRGNWLYFPSICWKSDTLVATSFREGLNVVQDLALALDLIKAGGQPGRRQHDLLPVPPAPRERLVLARTGGHPVHRGASVLHRDGRRVRCHRLATSRSHSPAAPVITAERGDLVAQGLADQTAQGCSQPARTCAGTTWPQLKVSEFR